MKLNLLEVRRDTVLNLDKAMEDIIKRYGNMESLYKKWDINQYEVKLEQNCIRVNYLGKVIGIPYYNKIFGKLLSEKRTNGDYTQIYDSFECKSLSAEDIEKIIVLGFDEEFYVKVN